MKKIKYTILGLLLFLNSSLFAWWDAGHMAVAKIAYEELQPDVKDKVDALIVAVSSPFPNYCDFVMASLWADDIVHDGLKSFFTWHKSSYPYDPEDILSASEHEKILAGIEGNDLVWAIEESLKTLGNSKATPWTKGFMLRFLIHIVGDIHQPAHCVTYYSAQFPKGDRGGTYFKIKHEKYKSLHILFDSAFGLCDRMPGRPMSGEDRQYLENLVSFLKKRFPKSSFSSLGEKNIDKWREESYDIGVRFAYANLSSNESPTNEFMEKGRVITERQLALAGYRLADLLNSILGE